MKIIKKEINPRLEILERSLKMENTASNFLVILLGIENIAESKTLSNHSGCLSFNQKIELLIDIDALSRDSKRKFQCFMEVRNQFMHNLNISTYLNFIEFNKSTKNFLIKEYNLQSKKLTEARCRKAILQLADDSFWVLCDVFQKIDTKISQEVSHKLHKVSNESFIFSLNDSESKIILMLKKEIGKSSQIDFEELYYKIHKIYINGYHKRFKELEKEVLDTK